MGISREKETDRQKRERKRKRDGEHSRFVSREPTHMIRVYVLRVCALKRERFSTVVSLLF